MTANDNRLQQLIERNANGDRVGENGFVWDSTKQTLTPLEPRMAEEFGFRKNPSKKGVNRQ